MCISEWPAVRLAMPAALMRSLQQDKHAIPDFVEKEPAYGKNDYQNHTRGEYDVTNPIQRGPRRDGGGGRAQWHLILDGVPHG
jgi:hypothetical protein